MKDRKLREEEERGSSFFFRCLFFHPGEEKVEVKKDQGSFLVAVLDKKALLGRKSGKRAPSSWADRRFPTP